MSKYSLAHLSAGALLAGTRFLVATDRATTAELIAHLAEVDARGLYLPEGYPSSFEWCTGHLGFSRDSACKRIRAARAARRFPAIFPMVADGRLSLSSVGLLAAHLTEENHAELLTAAAGLSKLALDQLIAERFPRTDLITMVTPVGAAMAAPATGGTSDDALGAPGRCDSAELVAPGPLHVPVNTMNGTHIAERARLTPIAAGRYALQVTIDQETFDALGYAKSLLGHSVPSGDLAQVLGHALKALVTRLEKVRFAKCARSAPSRRRGTQNPRHIPAAVRRLVWERDGGRCTFVGENDHSCEARSRLEFDHIVPVARGGQSTPGNLRLRCRAHNQMAAERAFGREFMRHQREEAKRRAMQEREEKRAAEAQAREAAREAERAARAAERERAASEAKTRKATQTAERVTATQARRDDVVQALRNLGYRAPDARAAAQVVDTMPGASLEQHLRAALKSLLPRSVRIERCGAERSAMRDGAMAEVSAVVG
jgi:5-methylcytosine-specific restriction endonuclease McrA